MVTQKISNLLLFRFPLSQNIISNKKSAGNQRYKSSLVESSETIRATTFSEYLSGVIDGDGCLLVNKKGYPSLEITMGLEDLPILNYIQHKIGGSIKIRSGAKAYRYRLHNKEGMINLIKIINGNIRHSTRILQLHRVCQILNQPIIYPSTLDNHSKWFTGFFDADGTITFSIKNSIPQLSIRVVNKNLQDIQEFKTIFGGSIYFDNTLNGYYVWSVQSRIDILRVKDSFIKGCRSNKSKRMFLIEDYYRLKDLKAYKEDSIFYKPWLNFIHKWNS